MTVQTKSSEETQALGTNLAKKIAEGGLVCLLGDLGSGKTTFVQGVARGLGIEERVSSPTFVLMRRYPLKEGDGGNFFYHIDLYRLENQLEIQNIGLEEIVANPNNIVLIEWPEKIIDRLPRQRWEVQLTAVDNDQRQVAIRELK